MRRRRRIARQDEVGAAGGADILIVPAHLKDLVDPGIQALALAQRVGDDPDQLPQAMSELPHTDEVEWRRPGDTIDDMGAHTTMVISVHPEGNLPVRRPTLRCLHGSRQGRHPRGHRQAPGAIGITLESRTLPSAFGPAHRKSLFDAPRHLRRLVTEVFTKFPRVL